MSMTRIRISSDRVVSFSAIVIAVASIFISVWQGVETRKHNRLSVRPKLEIMYVKGNNKIGYEVFNNGLGPAVINAVRIFVDDEEVGRTGFSGFSEFLDKLQLNDIPISHSAVAPGLTIRAGENRNIISFSFEGRKNLESKLVEIYRRVGMEISYESMYEESFVCSFPGNRTR